ncbi:retrotransposon protein, putative, ty1-copia subclass [Tanacetum coccineum]
MVRSMMNSTTLPKSFWGYVLESVARILNMVPTKKVDKTPYEIWNRKAPNMSYLKVWGSEALIKQDTPNKLKPRSVKCIFVGYPKETIGYYFYNPHENKIFVAYYAEFFENSFTLQEAIGGHTLHEANDEEHELGDFNEPPNYKAALSDLESNKWLDVMNVEIQSMKDNQVWCLVDLPPNGQTVRSKWIFKKKTHMYGNVHIFNAHLVAKGYTQTYGVDYRETFSPVADIRAIRILLAIATFYDYDIWQMNVKSASLNSHLSENVYMVQPEGFVDPKHPNKVCKLQRSIYELKQASRSWNKRFDKEIKKVGFTQNPDEPCVYVKASGSNVAFLVLFVDDILIMGNNVTMLQDVKSCLCKCFSMKDLGEATYILGIKIIRDRSKRLIALSQSANFDKILEKFKMENSKRGSVPMQKHLVSRFQQNLGEAHWNITDKKDIKSQLGYVFVLNDGVVDCKSAKQRTIAMSSIEDEYIAITEASMVAVWMRKFIDGLGNVMPTNNRPIEMLCDTMPAIAIDNDPKIIKGARIYQRKYHYIREVI